MLQNLVEKGLMFAQVSGEAQEKKVVLKINAVSYLMIFSSKGFPQKELHHKNF